MKSIFVNNKQIDLIMESMENSSIMNKLSYDNLPSMFGLDDCFKNLYINAYKNSINNFSNNIDSYPIDKILNTLGVLTFKCQTIEREIKPQLEKLCYNTLVSLFNIPDDDISIACHLVNNIPSTQQFHIHPDIIDDFEYDSYDEMEHTENIDVEKRKLINMFTCGGALSLANKTISKLTSELFELNEELPHLYSQLNKINQYLINVLNVDITDKNHHLNGYNKVTLGDDENKCLIEAYGETFPILLIETFRGFLEIFASFGLPDSKKLANKICNLSDGAENEVWDLRLGEEVWNILFNKINIEPKYLPIFLENLYSIESDDFKSVMQNIMYKTKEGHRIITNLLDKSKKEFDYNNFEIRMKDKANDKSLIDDEENINDDDLIDEAIYPESFSMDEFKSIGNFSKRIQYCNEHLERISSGSARIVFKIDNNTVLKLAKNTKGIAQNEVEAGDGYKDRYDCFADIYDIDSNYLWIEMQLARKVRISDFKKLTGYDFRFMEWFILYTYSLYSKYKNKQITPEIKNIMEKFINSDNFENTIFNDIYNYLSDYQLNSVGDLCRLSSYGIVKDNNGADKIVIIDSGLSDDVYDTYYRK